MSGNFSKMKNIIWALGIFACLLAVAVGFVIASVNRYSGDSFTTEVDLKNDTSGSSTAVTQLSDGSTAASGNGGGALMYLAETVDAGMEYIDTLTFICDSSVIGIRDYGVLSGGKDTYQVWGTEVGTLKISDLMNGTIVYPADGSLISIADAAMIAKPPRLVICVGQDGLSSVDENTFKASYSSMINQIRAASPDTILILSSISSISENYTGLDGLTKEMILAANGWIKDLCMANNCWYVDAGHACDTGYGYVHVSYLSTNGKTLNSNGVTEYVNYLRTHALDLQ